jgi:glycosyltransferase involved in cell wall biosynthesis
MTDFTKPKMKVLHIVGSIEDKASGLATSVPALCTALANLGLEVELASVESEEDTVKADFIHYAFPNSLPQIKSAFYSSKLCHFLDERIDEFDIVHCHSLWSMPIILGARSAIASSVPLVISPRGTLSSHAMAYSRLKKSLFSMLVQNRVLNSADAIHVTSTDEASNARKIGLEAEIAIIPNGVSISNRAIRQTYGTSKRKKLLYFGRIHPIKGIERLIAAWSKLEIEGLVHDWDLMIVGPQNTKYAIDLRKNTEQLGLKSAYFCDAVYGDQKIDLMTNSDVLILPTDSENFGMVVAEALSCGTPVITTKGAPWSDLQRYNCGWWVDASAEAIEAAIRDALKKGPERLEDMGTNGKALIEKKYSWFEVGLKTYHLYRDLISKRNFSNLDARSKFKNNSNSLYFDTDVN